MKVFPESNYSIELNEDSALAISELKKRTLSGEQFVVNWNNQAFRGTIKENEFEIKLSKKVIGALCVLNGKMEDKKGTLQIRTGKIFKLLFVAIILFSLSGAITAIIQNKAEVLFPIVINILVMRFIFLELGFRLVSNIALNKLTEITGIKKRIKVTE